MPLVLAQIPHQSFGGKQIVFNKIYMKEQVPPLNSFMVCCARQGMGVYMKEL
jgi:hypothetical protein